MQNSKRSSWKKTGRNTNGRKVKNWVQGSFTVEASLIMGIILMILVAILYASFYVHDKGVAQGIVCELTAFGNALSWEDTVEKEMEKQEKMLISSRFLHTEGVKVSVSKNEDQVSVSLSGNFLVPGFISSLFWDKGLPIEKNWQRIIYDPTDVIRKIRGVKYMVDGMDD